MADKWVKYFSEDDVQLFTMFNIDIGAALVTIGEKENNPDLIKRGMNIDEDLWHFRMGERSGLERNAAKLNTPDEVMNNKYTRQARVEALAATYSRLESLELSPFDWGMKTVEDVI